MSAVVSEMVNTIQPSLVFFALSQRLRAGKDTGTVKGTYAYRVDLCSIVQQLY
jgi:hypothetical protein